MTRLFRHGKVARSDSPELGEADVLVDDKGTIVAVARDLSAPEGTETIDCRGCVLVPGMFEVHARACEPGLEHRETLASCAASALRGGITGLVLLADTEPPIDSGNLVKSVMDRIATGLPLPMLQSGCVTKSREGREMAGYSGMAAQGVPFLSDAGRPVPCPDLLRRAMEYARDFDLPVASCCDTPALTKAGAMNEGSVSYRLGLPGIPSISEEIAIDRDLRVADYTGARLHLMSVTTARAVNAVAHAKADDVRVTCAVTPHHLVFTEEDVGVYDTRMKFLPPLRPESDREALLDALLSDVIDMIAADHAPHTEFEKSSDFGSAPNGASGLETTVLALYDTFIRKNVFGWDLLIRKYSDSPRRLAGVERAAVSPGQRADFFVFDPAAETRITRESLRTRGPVTPFLGRTLAGGIRHTVLGEAIHG